MPPKWGKSSSEGVWKGHTRGMGALEKQAVKPARGTAAGIAHDPSRAQAQALPHRSQREGMDAARAVGPRRQGRRPTGALGATRDRQCHLLRGARRLHLAPAAARSAPLADGLLLLPHLASRRDAGGPACPPPRAPPAHAWPRHHPQRRDHRQSVGEDDGKGGRRASRRPSATTAASK